MIMMENAAESASLNAKEKVRHARAHYSSDLNHISDFQWLVENSSFLSYRCFTFIGGFFIIIATLLDYYISYRPPFEYDKDFVNSIVILILANVVIQLEGRPYDVQSRALYGFIVRLVSPLKGMRMKGLFYSLIGGYQLYQLTLFSMVSGGCFILLGILWILYDLRASYKLKYLLRPYIHGYEDVKFIFNAFDDDRDGYLNTYEFKKMLAAFDAAANYDLFVATFAIFDVHNNQQISLRDMLKWYDVHFFDKGNENKESKKFFNDVIGQRGDRRLEDDKTLHLLF
jgi:hypothetical protein